MTRILVPTDFSERAGRAATWARETFPDAEVRLLHVLDPVALHAPSVTAPGGSYVLAGDGLEVQHTFEDEVQGRLQRLSGGELLVGRPEDEILRYAEAGRFDLIAVGVTGMGGAERGGLGHVTERLARESRVPVVVVQ